MYLLKIISAIGVGQVEFATLMLKPLTIIGGTRLEYKKWFSRSVQAVTAVPEKRLPVTATTPVLKEGQVFYAVPVLKALSKVSYLAVAFPKVKHVTLTCLPVTYSFIASCTLPHFFSSQILVTS